MSEVLFTEDEIRKILKEAENPEYSDPFEIHLGFHKTSIIRVSKESGLILVKGNEWTGYEHIISRHSQISRAPYWSQEGKLDNPSKFRLSLFPLEYITVASSIFKPENKNDQKNKNPEFFDVFIGNHRHPDAREVRYRLITYKGTGIIHTFFVDEGKKPFNKKKVLDLRQGWGSASHNLINGIQTFEMPYYDQNNIELFKVIMKKIEFQKIEKWYIQVNTNEGIPKLTTFIKKEDSQDDLSVPFKMTQIDFSEVAWIEQVMKQILNDQFEF